MIKTGQTPVGATNWMPYTGAVNAIFVDVDTSAALFTTIPNYVISLGGNQQHWEVVGSSSVYNATQTSFRVYIRFANSALLTPAIANNNGWHIVWIGMEP